MDAGHGSAVRGPAYKQLRKQIAQRAGSAKRQAKVAVGNATGAGEVVQDGADVPDAATEDVDPQTVPGDRGASGRRFGGGPARVRAPAAAAAAECLAAAPVRQEEAQVGLSCPGPRRALAARTSSPCCAG